MPVQTIYGIPVLTAFEEQVLEAMAQAVKIYGLERGTGASYIYEQGQRLYGSTWGGPERWTHTGYPAFPTVDAALGRLKNKGLIESAGIPVPQTTRTIWVMTLLGKLAIGIA